jgi:phage shock protein C
MALTLSRSDSWIGGVCGGIASWLGWDSNAVRLLYALISFFTGVVPGIVVYVVLLAVMPVENPPER